MNLGREVLIVDFGHDAETLGLDLLATDAPLRTVQDPFDAILAVRRGAPRAVVVNLGGFGRREREFVRAVSRIRGDAATVLLVPPSMEGETRDAEGCMVLRKPFVHLALRRALLATDAPPPATEPVASEGPSPPCPSGTAPEAPPARDPRQATIDSLESQLSWARSLGGRLGHLDDILRLTLERAVAITGGRRGSIQFLDRSGRELVVTKAVGGGAGLLEEMVGPAAEGIAGDVLASLAPRRGDQGIPESATLPAPLAEDLSGPFLSVPLRFGGRVFGVMHVVREAGDVPFDDAAEKALDTLVADAAGYILNAMELAEKERLALIDPLTGLFNRRYFDRRYPKELRRAQRYRHPLTLLILDIDDFKGFNDRHGYLAGDEVLKQVATLLRASFRQVDVLTRWGGEEFAVLLPETPKPRKDASIPVPALPFAERVLEAIRRHAFPLAETQPGGRITLSGGAATYPDDTQDPEELLVLANRALRRAKSRGKDRVCVFGAEGAEAPLG